MPSGETASLVTGSCTIGSDAPGLVGVNATMAVNSWPLFNLDMALYADEDAGSHIVTVEELRDKLKDWQEKINKEGLTGTVYVDDGSSGSMGTSGNVASVGLDVSVGRCRLTAVVLPGFTKLDALNLGIYAPCLKVDDADGALSLYARARSELKGGITLTSYTKKLVELLVGSYDGKTFADIGGADAQKVADAVHNVNTKVVDTFFELLGNSEGIDDVYGISGLLSDENGSNIESIGAAILSCLTRSTGSFLSSICAYANLFRLFYKPEMSTVGSLQPKSVMTADAGYGLAVPIAAISGNAYSTSQFPLGAVYSITDFSGVDLEHAARNKVHGYFNPELGGPSRSMRIAPPVWLTPVFLPGRNVDSKGGSAQKQASKPSEMQGEGGSGSGSGGGSQDATDALLAKWCEMEFHDQKWGNYTVALTSPGIDLCCGDRVSTELGEGFVRASQCIVALGQGGRGTCRTTYTMSHFKYGAGA